MESPCPVKGTEVEIILEFFSKWPGDMFGECQKLKGVIAARDRPLHILEIYSVPRLKTRSHDKVRIAERRMQVAEMYLKGQSQIAIAKHFGVTPPLICIDLKAIRAEWLESTLVDFNEKKAQELAKIDHLERVAYEAWERSCQLSEIKHQKTEKGMSTADGDKVARVKTVDAKTSEEQYGNPAYLARVAWCIETRIKIMGLIQDVVVNATQNNFGIPFEKWFAPPAVMADPVEAEIVAVAGGVLELGAAPAPVDSAP